MATLLIFLQLAIVLTMIFIGAKVVNQVCFKVIGNDTTVSFAALILTNRHNTNVYTETVS